MSKRERSPGGGPPPPPMDPHLNHFPGIHTDSEAARARKRKSRWGDDAGGAAANANPSLPAGNLQGDIAAAVSAALKAVSGPGGLQLGLGGYSGGGGGSALALVPGTAGTMTLLPGSRQADNPADRIMRRLYVGNVPPVSSLELMAFLNEQVMVRNPLLAGPSGLPITGAQVNPDKAFAFVDLSSADAATHTMVYVDGMMYKNNVLKVRRPKDYLPPPEGDPAERLRRTVDQGTLPPPVPQHDTEDEVAPGPYRVFVGNLNPVLRADAIKDVLTGCGPLRAFKLVFDRPDSDLSAGHAFAEWQDAAAATGPAVDALKGLYVGGRYWAVGRAEPDAPAPPPQEDGLPPPPPPPLPYDYSVPPHLKPLVQKPTRVLEITGLLEGKGHAARLEEDLDEYGALMEDILTEARRFGRVKTMHIPRPKDAERRAAEEAERARQMAGPLLLTSGGEEAKPGLAADFKPLTFVKSTTVQQPDFKASVEVRYGAAGGQGVEGEVLDTDEGGPLFPPGPPPGPPPGVPPPTPPPFPPPSPAVKAEEGLGGEGAEEGEGGEAAAPGKVYGLGKVYVEFYRTETCCEAAHNLHGRTFDGRPLSCAFFSLKLYQKNTGKGVAKVTREEKMFASLQVQEKLLNPEPLFKDPILGMTGVRAGGPGTKQEG